MSKQGARHKVTSRLSVAGLLAASLVGCAGVPTRAGAGLAPATAPATSACTTDDKAPPRVTITGAQLDANFKFVFAGNKELSSRQILDGIAAGGAGLLVDGAGAFSQDNLEHALLLMSSFYWDLGYSFVKLGTPSLDVARREVTIPIEEGPRFTIASVGVIGELIGGVPQNYAQLHTHSGVTFSRTMIVDDRARLSTYYQDLGYAYANVLPLTKVDLEHRQIGLTFEVATGKLAHIDHIDVRGNVKTSRDAILRDLQVATGDLFGTTKLVAAKCRILAAEHVSNVVISTTPGTSDELVDVRVEIAE